MSELAMPLDADRIERASRLREHLPGWVASDRALTDLAERFPGFGSSAVLIKTASINALFGTNIYAIVAVARHVEEVLREADASHAEPQLVERMARVELPAKVIRFRSFASKFAHYFIDAERFPILDSYAESMVSLHLGPRSVRDASQPYAAFVENLHTLKRLAGYTGSMRALDQYLWLAGQYQAWRRNADRPLNGEIRDLFEKRPDLAGLLDGE